MTYALDLDQQRCETQSAIAVELFTSGESDGFNGVYPQSQEYNYLAGYLKGVRRFSAHVQVNALLLQQEGQQLEEAVGEF